MEPPIAVVGAAAGEVTASSAVIWSKSDKRGVMHAVVEGGGRRFEDSSDVQPADDFTGALLFGELSPATRYRYRVWFSLRETPGPAVSGSFGTAPAADDAAAVRFAFGGDVGGQNVCRDSEDGYVLFAISERTRPDFFIALGDMIYADNRCQERGSFGNVQVAGEFPASTEVEHFWAHWRYNRADEHSKRLFASVPYYAVWDDHEVKNDFGPEGEGAELIGDGLTAFLDYNPIKPDRLYRKVRWGKHVELFFLDTRSYRASNLAQDSADKSMLGDDQRQWLERSLIESDATHKIVVTSVPLSIPTGSEKTGADSWTGFGSEIDSLLEALAAAKVTSMLWLTTDVHFATGFRYQPFDDHPEFELYEVVTGPMNAGLFPTQNVDPRLHPRRLFFYAPDSPPISWNQARRWMNVGVVEVSTGGALRVEVVNGDGETVWSSPIPPAGASAP